MMTSDQFFTPLAPWYRFQPNDQQVITYFLKKKIFGDTLPMNEIIEELKFYDYGPMQLSQMYGLADQKELYFFTSIGRKLKNSGVPKCKTSDAPKRKAGNGYWKSVRPYEGIKQGDEIIGYKKLLRFYEGSNRKSSTTTNWCMIEYKIGSYAWVLCKVYEKNPDAKNLLYSQNQGNATIHVTGEQHLHPYKSVKVLSELPFEIIIEILSWLPVKSLLKFKCVCKQWYSLIQDHKFMEKHKDRAAHLVELKFHYKWVNDTIYALLDEDFMLISSFSGLFLENSRTTPRLFRIRNPATQQALFLPDAHEGTSAMDFAFNSFTGECKGACFYSKREINVGAEVGLKVITIGKDDQWRSLKLPNQNVKLLLRLSHGKYAHSRCFGPDKIEGVAHSVEFISDGRDLFLEVQSFDVWSECFTTTTLPRGSFIDLRKVYALRWSHSVAVAEVAEEALNVLVLEDCKEHKWSKNKIIVPLKFLKDMPHLRVQIIPMRAGSDEDKLHDVMEYITFYVLHNNGPREFLHYDIKRETTQLLTSQSEGKYFSLQKKASLMTLKGMRPENGYNQE